MTNEQVLKLINEAIEQEHETHTRYISRRSRCKANEEYNVIDDREVVRSRVDLAYEL